MEDVDMLTENDVVKAIGSYLRERGYEIIKEKTTNERGIDLIASGTNQTWCIEAKGATSSKLGTKRYGKPFNQSQILSHVSRAVYESMKILGKNAPKSERAALGLPDNDDHHRRIKPIREALRRLEIAVFWVAGDKSVKLEDPRDGDSD